MNWKGVVTTGMIPSRILFSTGDLSSVNSHIVFEFHSNLINGKEFLEFTSTLAGHVMIYQLQDCHPQETNHTTLQYVKYIVFDNRADALTFKLTFAQ